MQLLIRITVAIPVNSSIIDSELYFEIVIDVRTIRQNPIRLDDAVRIWVDLFEATGI